MDGTARVYQAGTENQVDGRIPGFSDVSGDLVDGLPHISAKAVESTPVRRGVYRAGESILVSITYDRPVVVVGNPHIHFQVGHSQEGYAVAGRVHVSTVEAISDPGEDAVYEMGDTIELSATFDDEVTLTGTPRLSLDLDASARVAVFKEVRKATDDGLAATTSTSGDGEIPARSLSSPTPSRPPMKTATA